MNWVKRVMLDDETEYATTVTIPDPEREDICLPTTFLIDLLMQTGYELEEE